MREIAFSPSEEGSTFLEPGRTDLNRDVFTTPTCFSFSGPRKHLPCNYGQKPMRYPDFFPLPYSNLPNVSQIYPNHLLIYYASSQFKQQFLLNSLLKLPLKYKHQIHLIPMHPHCYMTSLFLPVGGRSVALS